MDQDEAKWWFLNEDIPNFPPFRLEDLLCQTEKIWISFLVISSPDFSRIDWGFWDAELGKSWVNPGVGHPSPSPGLEGEGGFQKTKIETHISR